MKKIVSELTLLLKNIETPENFQRLIRDHSTVSPKIPRGKTSRIIQVISREISVFYFEIPPEISLKIPSSDFTKDA